MSIIANADPLTDPLAAALVQAWRGRGTVLLGAQLEPRNLASAYQTQQRVLAGRGVAAGGWKIGAKAPDAPVRGAPLPRPGIHADGARIERRDFAVLGLEVEIYFIFGRDLLPQDAPLSPAEVLASLAWVGTAIEIVSSRISRWPDAAPLCQLADLQNHGALVLGEALPYREDLDWLAPATSLSLGGAPLFDGAGANPAGDPRRLLCWLVGHCREQGLALPRGSVVTTGSYSGMQFPADGGQVRGAIAALPPVGFTLL